MSRPAPPTAAHAWLALCALLGVAALAVALLGNPHSMAWTAATWPQRLWALWTASWVHLDIAHLLTNLLALAAVALLGWLWHVNWTSVAALMLAWPTSTLGLALWPAGATGTAPIALYAGLSGLVHAALAVAAVHALWQGPSKVWGGIALVGLAAKIAFEQAWAVPIAATAAGAFAVVVAAHLAGAVAGVVCAVGTQLVAQGLRSK